MKKNILILLCLVLFSLRSFSQWVNQNLNTTSDLYSVEYSPFSRIFIASLDGIIKSYDGGITWTTLPLLNQNNDTILGSWLLDVYTLNGTTALATGMITSGNSEVILRTTNGGANWSVVNLNNNGAWPRNMNDIYFHEPSSSIGYAVGSNGRILKTTNSGLTWTAKTSGTSQKLNSVFFTNAITGFAVGDNVILKTVNGGTNWTSKNFSNTNFKSVYFPSATIGYAVADNGEAYKTTNTGGSWQPLSIPGNNAFTDVFFTDNNTGYVTSGNTVLRTTDGGIIWEKQIISSATVLNSIHFLDSQTGFLVGKNGKAYKTTNGGGSYGPIASFSYAINKNCANTVVSFTNGISGPSSYSYQWLINGVVFSNSQNTTYTYTAPSNLDTFSLVVSNGINYDTISEVISATVDQQVVASAGSDTAICFGNTFQLSASGGTSYAWSPATGLNNVAISNPVATTISTSTYYVTVTKGLCTNTDSVTITVNDPIPATQWSMLGLLHGDRVESIDFLNSNVGFALYDNGKVVKTTDGGHTWSVSAQTALTSEPSNIDFVNSTVGYVAHNDIYKSIDVGVTFEEVYVDYDANYSDIFFLNDSVGYALSSTGTSCSLIRKIIKTLDGGDTWNTVFYESGGCIDFKKIFCLNKDTCFCVGGNYVSSQRVMRTFNGGQSWSYVTPNASGEEILDVVFVNEHLGFAGKYKTTDLGNTWTLMPMPTDVNPRRIAFVNADTGYFATTGTIYQTVNGGECWQRMAFGGSGSRVHDLSFVNSGLGYYSGETSSGENRIFKTIDSNFVAFTSMFSPATCNGSSTGTITITPSGGVPPYQFTKNNGMAYQTSNVFTNVAAGTYNVAVKDANNTISNVQIVTISQPTAVAFTMVSTNISCTNGTISITPSGGTPPYQFSVNDGNSYQTSPVFNNLIAGTYKVKVKDANNCITNPQNKVISQASVLSFTKTFSNVTCNNATNGSITITATGGSAPLQYSADAGQTFQNIASFTGLPAGTYNLLVKDANNCTTTVQSVVIIQPQALTGLVAQTNVSCYGLSNGSITVNGSGGVTPYQYSKDNGTSYQSSNNFTSLSAGNYDVKIKDANGCIFAQSVTILQPLALSFTETHSNITCSGNTDGSITITPAGSSVYQFSKDNGNSFQSSNIFLNLSSSTYPVIVKDSNNCVSSSQQILISQPDAITFIVTDTNVSCYGLGDGSISILASGGTTPYRYSINNGNSFQSSNDFNNLVANIYTIVVSDTNNCLSNVIFDTIAQPAALQQPTIANNGSLVFCDGDSIILVSSTAYSYGWSNGSSAQSSTVYNTSVVTVTVFDSSGCSSTSLPVSVIVNALPPVPTIVLSGNNLVSSSANGNQWYLNGTILQNDTLQNYIVLQDGTYTVVVTNNGCYNTSNPYVYNEVSVWPGDTDDNLVVNNFDLLPIGLYHSQAGIPRATVSNAWQSFSATDWGTLQTNGSDIKHVDSNGDGLINDADTLAVNLNFSLTHTISVNNYNQERTNDPEIYFVIPSNSYMAGDWVTAELWLGTSTLPVNNLYGFAFNIDYNSSMVESTTESITYNANNWIGVLGSNAITISKIDPLTTIAYGAITRTDHINSDGYGKIAEFKFQVNTNLLTPEVLYLSVINYKAIDANGTPLLFSNTIDSINVYPISTNAAHLINFNSGFTIHPNPFNNQTLITFNSEQHNTTIKVIDMLGKIIKTENVSCKQYILEKSTIQSGVYFVQVVNSNGSIVNKKIVIQ